MVEVCVAVSESLTSQPKIVSQSDAVDVAVADVDPSGAEVIKVVIVVEHSEAVSVLQLDSGSDEYVS